MRTTAITLLLALAASVAEAKPTDGLIRTLVRAEKELKKGSDLAAQEKRKMSDLRKAKSHLKSARRIANSALWRTDKTMRGSFERVRDDATDALVDVLNEETERYVARGSLSLAKQRNAEARALSPDDARALSLAAHVRPARRARLDRLAYGSVYVHRRYHALGRVQPRPRVQPRVAAPAPHVARPSVPTFSPTAVR